MIRIFIVFSAFVCANVFADALYPVAVILPKHQSWLDAQANPKAVPSTTPSNVPTLSQ